MSDEIISEAIEDAYAEIKRADHLIYVSLKYTRTVDVFKSILERLINTFECICDGLLKQLLEEKKIDEIPAPIKAKCDSIKENYHLDEDMIDYINFYIFLRRINKAEYTKRSEFRRHVTMSASMEDGKIIEVTIDVISEYFEKTKAFARHIRRLIGEDLGAD